MVVNIVERLQELGLSEYESKVYVALVRGHPVTAYEAAKTAGVPTSKVYGVLDRLTDKGLAMEITEQEKKRYVPLESDELVNLFQDRLTSTLGELRKDLKALPQQTTVSYIWNISDYEDLIRRAERTVVRAKKNILLSAWEPELIRLREPLTGTKNAGIPTGLVHFGDTSVKAGTVFAHPIQDTLYQEKGGRGFTLVVDSREAIVATVHDELRVEGAWSRNSGFVTLAEDYIKHDIYIMKIVRRFDGLLIDTFGPNYRRLRDVFSDTEEVREAE